MESLSTSPMHRLARVERVWVFVLLVILCALPLVTLFSVDDRGFWNVNRCTMSTPDEPSYLLMAKSIAGGRGISIAGLAGKDTFYPPGLPLLLAAWGRVFGFSIQSMHVCVALTLCGTVAMAYVLLRRILGLWGFLRPEWVALACTAVFATSWHVLETALFVFSEPLFMLLVFAWLYCALRIESWWGRAGPAMAVVALAIAATAARAAGLVCIAATVLYMILGIVRERGEKGGVPLGRRLLPVACVLGVILAYYVTIHRLSPEKSIASGGDSHNSYTRQLLRGVGFEFDDNTGKLLTPIYRVEVHVPNVARAVLRLFWDHIHDFCATLVPPGRDEDELFRGDLYFNLARFLALLTLAGWIGRLCRRGLAPTRFVELFFLLYVGLYLVWPFRMIRFWAPLLPLVGAYAADVLRFDARSVLPRPRAHERYVAVSLLMAVLLVGVNAQELVRKLPWYQARLNYVSDALAASAGTIRRASPRADKTIVCLDDEDYFAFSWYLNPGLGDTGYRVESPRRGEKPPIESLILRKLGELKADPGKRLFVVSYFKHDPRQPGEPTLLLVLRNLQRMKPDEFVQSDPDKMGFAPSVPARPGQWKIVKLHQDWNTTAVWEIAPAVAR